MTRDGIGRFARAARAACGIALVFLVQGCGEQQAAPQDAVLIAKFRANQHEFEYWKTNFEQPNQNCRIEIANGTAASTLWPCMISDPQKLAAFMDREGITVIDARSDTVYSNTQPHPVIFAMFARGLSIAGQEKAITSIPNYEGPLQQNLDKFSRRSDPNSGTLLPGGYWLRRIESDWYLQFDAS